MACAVALSVFCLPGAYAQDRIVSIGKSPFTAEEDANGMHGKLVDLVRALDRVTHSTSKIVIRPFARSLEQTAAGEADIHIPLIQNGDAPPPKGLAYVNEVDFGQNPFVIYSRKQDALDAGALLRNKKLRIESEPGHEALFPFPISPTYCVPCTLRKILIGRADAMAVPAEIVDPLLTDAQFQGIHRALYKVFPVRALVSTKRDSTAARRYLADGMEQLRASGELPKITPSQAYTDWQP